MSPNAKNCPPAATTTLALTDELCDGILTLYIRRMGPPLLAYAHVATAISPAFHVLPRANAPNVSRAVLMRLTWIDLDTAARLNNVWLLDTLLHLHPRVRPLMYSPDWLAQCARLGHVQVLQWWWETCMVAAPKGRPAIWATAATLLDIASQAGHVHVLDWCARTAVAQRLASYSDGRGIAWFQLDTWTEAAMDGASAQGHMHVLDWWWDKHQTLGWDLKYSAQALRGASQGGHVHVLDWWRIHVDDPHQFQSLLGSAISEGVSLTLLPVRTWWESQPATWLPDCAKLTTEAIQCNDLALAQWLADRSFWKPTLEHLSMAFTAVPGIQLQVVEQALVCVANVEPSQREQAISIVHAALCSASKAGCVDLLDLLQGTQLVDCNLVSDSSVLKALSSASEAGNTNVLEWWSCRLWLHKDASLVAKCMQAATKVASLQSLHWWKPAFCQLTPRDWKEIVSQCVQSAVTADETKRSLGVVEWWVDLCNDTQVSQALGVMALCQIFTDMLSPALEHGWIDYIVWAKQHSLGPLALPAPDPSDDLVSPLARAMINGHLSACLVYMHSYLGVNPGQCRDTISDWAARVGIANVTQWKRKAMQAASKRGDMTVLQWLHGIPAAHPADGYDGISYAAFHGHHRVVQWWLQSGLRLKDALMWTFVFRDPFLFDLWTRTGGPENGTWLEMQHPGTLDSYFFHSGVVDKSLVRVHLIRDCHRADTKNPCRLVDQLGSTAFCVQVSHQASRFVFLEWWLHCTTVTLEQRRKWSKGALMEARDVAVLEWWKFSGIGQLQVPEVDWIVEMRPHVAQWWRESGLLTDVSW